MRIFILLIGTSFLFTLLSCKADAPQKASSNVDETSPVERWLTFAGENDMPKIVLVSGDEEYRSEEALPLMAKILNKHHGFNCTVLFAQEPDKPGIVNPNYVRNIPGLENLGDADLMLIFTRFRALPDEQMQHIEDFLKKGKSVIGIRTATHAFHFRGPDPESKWAHYGNFYEGDDEWKGGFGRLVLGEKWISHHGHHRHQSTRGIIAPNASAHPIVNGIDNGSIWGATDVYGVRLPLPGDARPIVLGQVVNRPGEYDENDKHYGMRESDNEVATVNPARKDDLNPNDPMMPIAWTKSYIIPGGKTGRAFTSTIGSSTDLMDEETRRLLVNATFHLLDLDVPEKANVDIIGDYDPTPYMFVDDQYWVGKNLTITLLK